MTTQTSPSRPGTGPTSRPRIAVGLEYADQSTGAVLWASGEAAREKALLQVVTACPTLLGPAPGSAQVYVGGDTEATTRESMTRLTARLGADVATLPPTVTAGSPTAVLLDAAGEDTRMLVVGSPRPAHAGPRAARQHLDRPGRPLTGAGRGRARRLDPGKVFLGPGGGRHHPRRRQRHRGAAVRVRAGPRPAGPGGGRARLGDPGALRLVPHRHRRLPQPGHRGARGAPRPVAEGVRRRRGRRDHGGRAGLQRRPRRRPVAKTAIVGRHTPASRHRGLRLGSTARAVLHRAKTPVAVVPLSGPTTPSPPPRAPRATRGDR